MEDGNRFGGRVSRAFLGALVAAGVAWSSGASAAPVDFAGSLTLQLGALDPIVSVAGGQADVNPDLSFVVPAGTFSLSGNPVIAVEPSGPGAIVAALLENVTHDVGLFGGGFGLMPFTSAGLAVLFVDGANDVLASLPLQIVGSDGSVPGDTGVGALLVGGPFQLFEDTRGPDGLGNVHFVSHFQLFVPEGETFVQLPDNNSAVVSFSFVPEPGSALLIGAGLAGIAGGRRRR